MSTIQTALRALGARLDRTWATPKPLRQQAAGSAGGGALRPGAVFLTLALVATARLGRGQYVVDFEGVGETKTGYAPGTVSLSGSVSHSGGDTTASVTVSGMGEEPPLPPPALDATAVTAVTSNGFTVNWTAVDGATGYRLDVASLSTFDIGGSESFENSTATGIYGDGTFVGDHGITWHFFHSRNEGDYPIDGKGLMLRNAVNNSHIYSASVPGGIGSFSCQLRKAFTGAYNRQVELFVNGVSQGTSESFGNFSGADDTVHTFEVNGIDIAGDVVIRVDNIAAGQVMIDNIVWTPYPSAMVDGYDSLDVGNTTSVEVEGLNPSRTYYLRVFTLRGASESVPSDTLEVTTKGPMVTVSEAALTPFATVGGTPSAAQSFTVEGDALEDDLKLTAPAGFELSLSSEGGFTDELLLTPDDGTVVPTTVYVRLIGSVLGSFSGAVQAQSDVAMTRKVEVSGEVTLATPATLAPTHLGRTRFKANWTAVLGATGYRLDVYDSDPAALTPLFEENFASFDGSGLEPNPAAESGRLDSNRWKVLGMSGVHSDFGGTQTAGDFARGLSAGGVTTGGLYAFETDASDPPKRGLGVQPTGTVFTPGHFVLRVQNTTGATLGRLQVAYAIYALNDQDRSNSFNFSHSADDDDYTDVPEVAFTSPAAKDESASWQRVERVAVIDELNIEPGGWYYLRWSSADVGGSGYRDELALDEVQVSGGHTHSFLDGFENLAVSEEGLMITGLESGATYYYQVRAAAGAVTTAKSDLREVTTDIHQRGTVIKLR